VAAELGRDRSGLLRTLKSLGYPTAPERPDPACRRADTLQRIESLKPLSHDEIKQRILQLRRRRAARERASRPSRSGFSLALHHVQTSLPTPGHANLPIDDQTELAEWLPLTGAHTSGLA
jgi:hypothetical protein